MRRSFLLLFLVVLTFAHGSRAGAQKVEFYGTLAFTHLSNVPAGEVQSPSGFQEQYTSITPVGVGGGITVNVLSLPLVSLGLDVRGMNRQGAGGAENALFGVKLTAKTPVAHVKPYMQGAAGFMVAHTRNVSSPASGMTTTDGQFASHYAMYEVLAGIDYPLRRVLDFRIIEIGAGSSFGTSPNTSVFSVNSGLVLHF